MMIKTEDTNPKVSDDAIGAFQSEPKIVVNGMSKKISAKRYIPCECGGDIVDPDMSKCQECVDKPPTATSDQDGHPSKRRNLGSAHCHTCGQVATLSRTGKCIQCRLYEKRTCRDCLSKVDSNTTVCNQCQPSQNSMAPSTEADEKSQPRKDKASANATEDAQTKSARLRQANGEWRRGQSFENNKSLTLLDFYSNVNKFPTRQEKYQLSAKLGLSYKQVNIWFANRRMRDKPKDERRKRPKQEFTDSPTGSCSSFDGSLRPRSVSSSEVETIHALTKSLSSESTADLGHLSPIASIVPRSAVTSPTTAPTVEEAEAALVLSFGLRQRALSAAF